MTHRDVKPHNLMLTPKGLVKVLDFGLARVRTEHEKRTRLTQLDSFLGTPEYAAPEQAMNARDADTRADIYSLGCTLYALLAGRPPFREGSLTETVLAHIEKEAKPLRRRRSDVPAALSAVVAQMLAKDPAARPQTPGAVARALAPFATGVEQAGVPAAGAALPAPHYAKGSRKAAPRSSPPEEAVTAVGEWAPASRDGAGPPPKVAEKTPQTPAPVLARWWQRPTALTGMAAATLALGVTVVAIGGLAGALNFATRGQTDGPVKGVALARDRPTETLPGKTVRNSLGMAFAWIPPGSFLMGSDRHDDEKPVHRVAITRGFYMGVYPVTQAQWKEVMGNNPSAFRGDDNRPVENVSWDDCQEFCERLRRRDDKPYRLPTEAEWEYACRAGTTTEFCTGDGEGALKEAGWYRGNSDGKTHAVGRLAPNAWGLYDLHGNVWQWCQDRYGPYPAGAVEDQKGPEQGAYGVRRGGSWLHNPDYCLASRRNADPPDSHYHDVGCRVCFRHAPPTDKPDARKRKSVMQLIEDLKNGDGNSRLEAANMLAERGPAAALVARRQLAEALKDRDPALRLAAAKALARTPNAGPIPEVGAALALADEAAEADDYEGAERLARVAQASTTSPAALPVAAAARARLKEVAALREAYEAIPDAVRALGDTTRIDPHADLALGRFYALAKGDWDRGLSMLARGSDPKLRTLAQTDLASPADARAAEELGDGYAARVASESGVAQTNLLCRACYWYEQAEGRLSGPDRTRVQKKVAAIDARLTDVRPVVLYARYGAFQGWADATDLVRWLVVQGQASNRGLGTKRVTSEDLGIPDPAFGQYKSLIIVYRHRGGRAPGHHGGWGYGHYPASPGTP
jgi:formylglycine-generating enzyme required for sulfatase activity